MLEKHNGMQAMTPNHSAEGRVSEDLLAVLRGTYCAEVTLCGSRVTCNPAPIDTDQDYLVVAPESHDNLSDLVSHLYDAGFEWEGSEHYQSVADNDFMSWRRGTENLIVTRNQKFAARHKAATHVCKTLNLLEKPHRIMVFQAVLYGNVAP